ncbi:MAG: DUF3426 domain-containing protein [Janthinobacterium lividum]
MSLATRCPACGTIFKVARDQLRISDGWVRCGRCSEVFDGNESLDGTNTEKGTAVVAPAETTFDFPDLATFPGARFPSSSEEAFAPKSEPVGEQPADEPVASTAHEGMEPVPAPWLGQWPSLELQPGVQALAPAPAEIVPPPASAPGKPFDAALASALAEPAASLLAASEPGTPAEHGGFASLEQRDGPVKRWLRRLPGFDRLPLRTISVGALVLLAAQSIYHSRDALAAHQPALQPALAAMCSISGCQLSALRRIDAFTIDGTSFARDPSGEGYQLMFSVRNRAAMPLAMPAVEVTLLDTQEQAVVRRVLLPADFGAAEVLPANTTRSVMLPLALSDAPALPAVAGYGIAAFYP